MSRKTVYIERQGIRVEAANKTEAEAAWKAARDSFVSRAVESPFVFVWQGAVLVVSATAHGWHYGITVLAEKSGVQRAICYYDAESQTAAIAVGLGAMAQRLWNRSVVDDAEYFDSMVKAAGLYESEVKRQREDFLRVVEFWRAHPVAA